MGVRMQGAQYCAWGRYGYAYPNTYSTLHCRTKAPVKWNSCGIEEEHWLIGAGGVIHWCRCCSFIA